MTKHTDKREENSTEDTFLEQYKGGFYGVLKWPDLDKLWAKIKTMDKQWYVYQIGEIPSTKVLQHDEFLSYIDELDKLLHEEHEEKYCGIVYIDDKENPSFIKVYDPANLGSPCGSSGAPPPLPGWTITLSKPCDLHLAFPIPAKRKRWWKNIFG